jgi:hypothetical protein
VLPSTFFKPVERSEMEKWNKIESFEAYEVSDFGRVRRAMPCAGSRVGRILKQTLYGTNKSYLYVGLSQGGKVFQKRVHILVAKAFIPNPLRLPEVNHKGPKTNNRATKLEWRSKLGHAQDGSLRKQRGDGVSFNTSKGKYKAGYSVQGKWQHLGYFGTYKEAAEVRDAAVKALPEVL